MTEKEMYLNFRTELDNMAFPLIKDWANATGGIEMAYEEGKAVGFMIVVDSYIDALYVLPDYRRKGIASRLVMDYCEKYGTPERLTIISTNVAAIKFWQEIFYISPLSYVDPNPVDITYRIVGIKKRSENE